MRTMKPAARGRVVGCGDASPPPRAAHRHPTKLAPRGPRPPAHEPPLDRNASTTPPLVHILGDTVFYTVQTHTAPRHQLAPTATLDPTNKGRPHRHREADRLSHHVSRLHHTTLFTTTRAFHTVSPQAFAIFARTKGNTHTFPHTLPSSSRRSSPGFASRAFKHAVPCEVTARCTSASLPETISQSIGPSRDDL